MNPEKETQIMKWLVNNYPNHETNCVKIWELIKIINHYQESNASWLSPIESERQWQEKSIKKIWPGYPDCSFRWQYLNGLIRMTCEHLKIDVYNT